MLPLLRLTDSASVRGGAGVGVSVDVDVDVVDGDGAEAVHRLVRDSAVASRAAGIHPDGRIQLNRKIVETVGSTFF